MNPEPEDSDPTQYGRRLAEEFNRESRRRATLTPFQRWREDHFGKALGWWWVGVLVLGLAFLGIIQFRDYERRRNYPCQYETIAALTDRYSELRSFWERQQAELDAQEARHKIQDAIIELRIKRGTITNEALVAFHERRGKEMEDLFERQHREFQALCQRLVGR